MLPDKKISSHTFSDLPQDNDTFFVYLTDRIQRRLGLRSCMQFTQNPITIERVKILWDKSTDELDDMYEATNGETLERNVSLKWRIDYTSALSMEFLGHTLENDGLVFESWERLSKLIRKLHNQLSHE